MLHFIYFINLFVVFQVEGDSSSGRDEHYDTCERTSRSACYVTNSLNIFKHIHYCSKVLTPMCFLVVNSTIIFFDVEILNFM